MRFLRKAKVESLERHRPIALPASVTARGAEGSAMTTISGSGSLANVHATNSRPFALAAGGRTGGFFVRGR
jgi:hypothetical protein